jgi:hypothetical protein
MIKTIFITIALIGFSSCSKNYEKIEAINWMIGDWEAKVQGSDLQESWTKIDDSTLLGESYFVKDGDTLFTESMTIHERKGILSFNTLVDNPNEGDTIQFVMIKNGDRKVQFENLLHDFPQQVVYTSPTKDSLNAYIDGNLNGNYERIDFLMKKKK